MRKEELIKQLQEHEPLQRERFLLQQHGPRAQPPDLHEGNRWPALAYRCRLAIRHNKNAWKLRTHLATHTHWDSLIASRSSSDWFIISKEWVKARRETGLYCVYKVGASPIPPAPFKSTRYISLFPLLSSYQIVKRSVRECPSSHQNTSWWVKKAFSSDSQNTCWKQSTPNAVPVTDRSRPYHPHVHSVIHLPYLMIPSDLLTRLTFQRMKLRIFSFQFPNIWLSRTKQ